MARHYAYKGVFLFDTHHESFLQEQGGTIIGATTKGRAFQKFMVMFFLVALPIALAISLLVRIAGYNIVILLPFELLLGAVMSACFAFISYRQDHHLLTQGTVIYGEIVHSETQPVYTNIANNLATRLHYRFMTPNQETVIGKIDLNYPMQRLPDGRKYPEIGSKIAVLYADTKNHQVL